MYLDRRWMGKTPLSLDELRPGTATLRIQKEGFADSEQRIELQAGQVTSLSQTLAENDDGWWAWGMLGGLLLTSFLIGSVQRQRMRAEQNANEAGDFGITGLSF